MLCPVIKLLDHLNVSPEFRCFKLLATWKNNRLNTIPLNFQHLNVQLIQSRDHYLTVEIWITDLSCICMVTTYGPLASWCLNKELKYGIIFVRVTHKTNYLNTGLLFKLNLKNRLVYRWQVETIQIRSKSLLFKF